MVVMLRVFVGRRARQREEDWGSRNRGIVLGGIVVVGDSEVLVK